MSSHRGIHRGFDRGRGIGFSRAPQNLPPPKPLGPNIDSINIKTLLTEEVAPTIKGVEYVASYNWIGGKSPVILVPGESLNPQLLNIKPIRETMTPPKTNK
jgi:hypothetical protein